MRQTSALWQSLVRHLIRFLRYSRAFGVASGIAAFWKLHVLASYLRPNDLVHVRIPGCRSPLALRAHTSDIATFEQIFLDKEYEFDFSKEFSPKLIVDGGANIGLAAVYFANRYPHARVVSIEPESSNFEILLRNASSYPRIEPIRAAVWSASENLRIKDRNAAKWLVQVERSRGTHEEDCRGITIDDIASKYGDGTIDLLKLDIEGAERELFSSACDAWINCTQVMIVELHDWLAPGAGKAFFSATSKHDFDYFHRGEHEILISRAGAHHADPAVPSTTSPVDGCGDRHAASPGAR
jgi:FkbM family methyltransferase